MSTCVSLRAYSSPTAHVSYFVTLLSVLQIEFNAYFLCSPLPKGRIDNVTERKVFGQTDNIHDIPMSLIVVYHGYGFHSKSKAHYKVLKSIYGF